MRTQTLRRADAAWKDIGKGLLLAVAATAALVAVFALVISLLELSDGVIRAVNQAIKLLSVYIGARAATPSGGTRTLLKGAAVGALYMAVGVLVYSLLTPQPLGMAGYLADVMLGAAFGALIGLVRARKT